MGTEELGQADHGERSNAPAWRRLLSDPPLIDRITWREGIRPQTLVSRDRGLMARAFGTLFAIAGASALLIVAIGQDLDRSRGSIVALALVCLALAAICFVGYRRLSGGFFGTVLVAGTLMITAAAAGASDGAEAVYGFFYVWIVFIAFLFFSPRAAAGQALLAAVAYGVVMYARDTPHAVNLMVAGVATIGTTGALMGLLMARVERVATALATQAHTDPVTTIANRRDFDQRFERALARATRSGRPLSLIICDLDRFKHVNDALGHEEGDVALRRAARAIAGAVRSMDAVARLGGEEFGVIVPDAGGDEAMQIAERVRAAISTEFAVYPVRLTASCGVACSDDTDEGDESLFRAADMALYAAKRGGRDRTVAFEAAASTPADATGAGGHGPG